MCSRVGFKQKNGLNPNCRKHRSKNGTRCGCDAMCRVYVNIHNGRWYVSKLNFDHNRGALDVNFSALLAAHGKMSATDILQIDNF